MKGCFEVYTVKTAFYCLISMYYEKVFIFIAFALCSFWQLRAQADTASFLFDKYEDAQVVLRAGGELKSKMNYNIVANKFYFVDPQDKQVKELANPEIFC